MTDWTARTVELSLGFLGQGNYRATLWQDTIGSDLDELRVVNKEVAAEDALTLSLVSGGGMVACFEVQ